MVLDRVCSGTRREWRDLEDLETEEVLRKVGGVLDPTRGRGKVLGLDGPLCHRIP